jgi:hypothetical protein
MNSRSFLLLGWFILGFFWLLTPIRSQYFVPTAILQDQALQQQLDTAYDHLYAVQGNQEQQQGLEQAQNAWLTYRITEAFWESGTKDVNSPDFQKAMSRMTQVRIEEMGKLVTIHPANYTAPAPRNPGGIQYYNARQDGLYPQRSPNGRGAVNPAQDPATPPPSPQPRFY